MFCKIMGALEFAAFLGLLCLACCWLEKLPIIQKINHLLGLDGESE